jgi:hypothetical protein
MEPDGVGDHAPAFLYRVNGTITVIAVGTSKTSVRKNRPDLLWHFQVVDLEYGPTAKFVSITITLGTCKSPTVPYNPVVFFFEGCCSPYHSAWALHVTPDCDLI